MHGSIRAVLVVTWLLTVPRFAQVSSFACALVGSPGQRSHVFPQVPLRPQKVLGTLFPGFSSNFASPGCPRTRFDWSPAVLTLGFSALLVAAWPGRAAVNLAADLWFLSRRCSVVALDYTFFVWSGLYETTERPTIGQPG